MTGTELHSLIEKCKSMKEIDDKIAILFRINECLPKSQRLRIPSLISWDYVSTALETVQERIGAKGHATVTSHVG